jgi:hypothetical protein
VCIVDWKRKRGYENPDLRIMPIRGPVDCGTRVCANQLMRSEATAVFLHRFVGTPLVLPFRLHTEVLLVAQLSHVTFFRKIARYCSAGGHAWGYPTIFPLSRMMVGGFYSENTMQKNRSKGTVCTRHQSAARAHEQSGAILRLKGAVGGYRRSGARPARGREPAAILYRLG